MTIAQADKEISELIAEHHMYGAETICNALVRAVKTERWIDERDLIKLIIRATRREEDADNLRNV